MFGKYKIDNHYFDVIVVGGGGAGLRASIEAARKGLKVACVGKLFPIRSNTVAAQGGIAAALSNIHQDDWRWHFMDTVKSAGGLGDQNAIELLCKEAPSSVIELEKMGVPFSRTSEGKIYQRQFGGMMRHDDKGGFASRTCAVADRTGHGILHTLYQQCLRYKVTFFSEFFVFDLLFQDDNKSIGGCFAWDLNCGKFALFVAPVTILTTGGYARIYQSCTASYACTGDAGGMLTRLGLSLQDQEFVQFHPTALYPSGCLLSEAVRAEGAYLTNKHGNRFMKKYDPLRADLSTRDIVSRAIAKEILDKNGCGPSGKYINLHASHIDSDVFINKLPSVYKNALLFAGVDMLKDDVPVFPAAHYTMGGVPININCEVLDGHQNIVKGLMSAGEAACVSVHGANRLGSNSLLDLVVFGSIAGRRAAFLLTDNNVVKNNSNDTTQIKRLISNENLNLQCDKILNKFDTKRYSDGFEDVALLRKSLTACMQNNFGPFRSQSSMEEGINKIQKIHKQFLEADVVDRGLIWNTNLVELFELENMLLNAISLGFSAINRKESRGSHYRDDFPNVNPEFTKHSLVNVDHNTFLLNYITYRPVNNDTKYTDMIPV
ncbi:MAG: FAD-binding protein [Alphaproteobacteria bacterium]|nr:FAD-binding protein [Rickettsiales bacterium]